MKALIVDTDLAARHSLQALLKKAGNIEVIGACSNVIQAMSAIHHLHPDIIFLDIQMPRLHVMEALSVRDPKHTPHVVFMTANDKSTVHELKTHALDYLLKPTSSGELSRKLARLQHQLGLTRSTLSSIVLRHIPCSANNRIFLVRTEEVEFAYSRLEGVYINDSGGQERLTELTLNVLENKTTLFRCHRQFLVNLDRIREIRLFKNGLAEIEVLSDKVVPVSRRYLHMLKEQFALS